MEAVPYKLITMVDGIHAVPINAVFLDLVPCDITSDAKKLQKALPRCHQGSFHIHFEEAIGYPAQCID